MKDNPLKLDFKLFGERLNPFIALLSVGIATFLHWKFSFLIPSKLWLVFYPAIFLLAWHGGFWSSLSSLFLSFALTCYLFIDIKYLIPILIVKIYILLFLLLLPGAFFFWRMKRSKQKQIDNLMTENLHLKKKNEILEGRVSTYSEKGNVFNISLLNSFSDHIAILDFSGTIKIVNDAWKLFADQNGAKKLDNYFLDTNYFEVLSSGSDYLYGEQCNEALNGIRSVLDRKIPEYTLEYQCHSPMQERWFAMHVNPIFGKDGGVIISHKNITDLKILQREKTNERRDKDLLINCTKDLIWSIDHQFKLITANDAFKENVKNAAGVTMKRGDLVLNQKHFTSEVITVWESLYRKAFSGEFVIQEFFTPANKDNLHEWIEISLNPIRVDAEVVAVACYGKDITTKKESEIALLKLNEEILESKKKIQESYIQLEHQKYAIDQHAIIAVTDAKGIIQYVNEKFCKISKYEGEELIGKTHRIINSGYHSKYFFKNMYNTIEGGNTWKGEICNRAKDKSIYWVHTTIVPLMDLETKKPIQFIAIRTDITQQKKQEQEKGLIISELSQRNKDLLQFSYIVSHNLRAPVSNLLGLLGLIDDYEFKDEYIKKIIESFNTSTTILSETLNDLNQIIVIKKEVSIGLEMVNFREVMEKVLSQIEKLILKKKPKITADFENASSVYFNKEYLESIFLNLFTNSLKFSSPDRELELKIFAKIVDGIPILSFEDNGIGLDVSRYKDRIFGLYQKFHDHSDSKGLGLYLIKSQIEALGGNIEIESTVNVGTRFVICFPKNKRTFLNEA